MEAEVAAIERSMLLTRTPPRDRTAGVTHELFVTPRRRCRLRETCSNGDILHVVACGGLLRHPRSLLQHNTCKRTALEL